MRSFVGVSPARVLLACLMLAGCASAPLPSPDYPHPAPAPVQPGPAPAPTTGAISLTDLPGWDQENHLAALAAAREACSVTRDKRFDSFCAQAKASAPADDASAKAFLENGLRALPALGPGRLTAYFAPVYPASPVFRPPFTAPVRHTPGDLAIVDLGAFDASLAGRKIMGRIVGNQLVPYDDRSAIEAAPTERPIAWMRPEDLFFLQIQGSGVLALPDGRLKISFSASNGRPFVGISQTLHQMGALPPTQTTAGDVHRWLADHRGPEADAVMRQDPRYVFFIARPDDGRPPIGAAGLPLYAGRAAAIDPTVHAYGELIWLAPSSGAIPPRVVAALDTGGAIKGPARADLYLGEGDAAGEAAGGVSAPLYLYTLVPAETAP